MFCFSFSYADVLHGNCLLTRFNFSIKVLLANITFLFWILLCYLLNISSLCIASISWCCFVDPLFRCSSHFPLFCGILIVSPVFRCFASVPVFGNTVWNLPEKANYTESENQFPRVLNKNVPLKSKIIRGNNKLFVTKTLRKVIMRRSALKKNADNLNDPLAIKLYKKQRNYVVNLSWKVKKDYFQKHIPHGSPSKNFWKFCKPFFTNQITNFDAKDYADWKRKRSF